MNEIARAAALVGLIASIVAVSIASPTDPQRG
jgi:hypothetical protein